MTSSDKSVLIRAASFLTYLCVNLVIFVLVLFPLSMNWGVSNPITVICFGAAASLLSAEVLALLTRWQEKSSRAEIASLISTNLEPLVLSNAEADQLGLGGVFSNRNESLNAQYRITENGSVFLFATTLNSFLALRSRHDPRDILSDMSLNPNWTARFLIVHPEVYTGDAFVLDSRENIRKLLNRLERIRENDQLKRAVEERRIMFAWSRRVPSYFLIGNSDEILISFYDYSAGGEQPVFRFLKGDLPGNVFQKYRLEFEESWEEFYDNQTTLDGIIEELLELRKIN